MRAVSLWNHRLEEKKKLFTKNLATAVDVRYAAVAAKAYVLSRIFYYHVQPNTEVEWWLLDAWIMNWLVGKTDIMSKPQLSQKTKVTHSVWSQILGGQFIHNQPLFQTILNLIFNLVFASFHIYNDNDGNENEDADDEKGPMGIFQSMTMMIRNYQWIFSSRLKIMIRNRWVFSS